MLKAVEDDLAQDLPPGRFDPSHRYELLDSVNFERGIGFLQVQGIMYLAVTVAAAVAAFERGDDFRVERL